MYVCIYIYIYVNYGACGPDASKIKQAEHSGMLQAQRLVLEEYMYTYIYIYM